MLNFPYLEIILLILGFGFLIFVHELGHFLVAKWVGIRCTQFAIGFGPSMLSWRKGIGFRTGSTEPEYHKRIEHRLGQGRLSAPASTESAPKLTGADLDRAASELGLGETEYRLNYLPLGGYVKMLGQEDLDPNARSDDPRAYNSKPIWARSCVISAGVVMNMIFGLIFFIIAFMMGVEFPPAIVGGVAPGSPAADTYAVGHPDDPAYRGLEVGDHITHLDGEPIKDMLDIRIATALGKKGEPIQLTVQRDGEAKPLTYEPVPKPSEDSDGLLSIGIYPPISLTVSNVISLSAVAEAGIQVDDKKKIDWIITAVNGEPVDTYAEYRRAVTANENQPVLVSFAERVEEKRTGKTIDVKLIATPGLVQSESDPANLLGIVPATRITRVDVKTPAAEAGVQPGDVIARINDQPWPTPLELSERVREADGRSLHLIVMRDGRQVDLGEIIPEKKRLGIVQVPLLDQPLVGRTLPGSPAAALELPGGSCIEAINGVEVHSWADMQQALATLPDTAQPVDVTFRYQLNIAGYPVESAAVMMTPEAAQQLTDTTWMPPQSVYLKTLTLPVVGDNPIAAMALGVEKTHQFMVQTYITLLRLAQGSVKPEHLRGPVGIVDEGAKMADRGIPYLLFFLGLISVNLAVINFLPLPIVDGGHMVFLLIEKVKGSPASPAVQIAAMWVGLALIGGVFLLVTYNDIKRLVIG